MEACRLEEKKTLTVIGNVGRGVFDSPLLVPLGIDPDDTPAILGAFPCEQHPAVNSRTTRRWTVVPSPAALVVGRRIRRHSGVMHGELELSLDRIVDDPLHRVGSGQDRLTVVIHAVPLLGVLALAAGGLRDHRAPNQVLVVKKLDGYLAVPWQLVGELQRIWLGLRHACFDEFLGHLPLFREDNFSPDPGVLKNKARSAHHIIGPGRAAACLQTVWPSPVELHRSGHGVAALERSLGTKCAPGNAVFESVSLPVRHLCILALVKIVRNDSKRSPFRTRRAVGHAELHGDARLVAVGVVPEREMDDIVARVHFFPIGPVGKNVFRFRIRLGGINRETELTRIGIPTPVSIRLGVLTIHHRRGVAHLGGEVDRLTVIHEGEFRALGILSIRHHEHVDLAGEIPIVELAIKLDLAGSRHSVELLVAAQPGFLGVERDEGLNGEEGGCEEVSEFHRVFKGECLLDVIVGLDALGVKILEFTESSATPEWLWRPVSSGHGSRGWKCSRDTGTNHGPSR